MTRISARFNQLQEKRQKAFIAYIMAGDPCYETSLEILNGLPDAGVDIIELGIPFTDPIADGPTIQMAGQRALANGQNVAKTLEMVRLFRTNHPKTPLIIMGYYNPIFNCGVNKFLNDAKRVGVDGLIVVDLPPEEDQELCIPTNKMGLNFIRLATPTTDNHRLPKVLQNTSGFVYFVSITGITGAKAPDPKQVGVDVARIKSATALPVCVGFGVKNPETARAIGNIADGVVVGSSIVKLIEDNKSVKEIHNFVNDLAHAVHSV